MPNDLILKYENRHSSKELQELGIPFDFAKPTDLIVYLIKMCGVSCSDIVLDFFAGSGTTAHALMKVNSKDGGARRCISVQLPEPIDIDDKPFKEGFKKISDITKERIKRAGDKVLNDWKADLFNKDSEPIDIGFKVFTLDTSNINTWDSSPENLESNLFNAQNNIKVGRSESDILYEILLKYGMDLTLPIEEIRMANKAVYNIGDGALFICLADDIGKDVAEGIGKRKQELNPTSCKVIFKDTGFTDVEKANSVQILKRFGITDVNSI